MFFSLVSQSVEYYSTALSILLLGFIPGYILLRIIPNDLNEEERLCTSFGLTVLLIGLGYSLSYLASSSVASVFPQVVFSLVVLPLIYFGIRGRRLEKSSDDPLDVYLLAPFLVQFLLKISLQPLIPFYPMGADYYEHYERARFFLDIHKVDPYKIMFPWWHVPDRTPLFNIVGAFFLALFRDRYWILQAVSCLFNSILILPGYLIAKKLFGRRTAILTVLFISMNPFLTENALYTWQKNLAAYFCLLLIYFVVFQKNTIYSGLSAGLGYLTHQYSALYIVAGVIYLLTRRVGEEKTSRSRELLIFLSTLGLVVSPWFLWKWYTYGSTLGTRFLYYPFAVHGVIQALQWSGSDIMSEFWSTPATMVIWIRIANAMETLIPVPILSWPITISNLSNYYFHTIPGALTIAPLIFSVLGLWRKVEELKRIDQFLYIPFLGTLLTFGWLFGEGLARQTMQPIVVLLVIFAASILSESRDMTSIGVYLIEAFEFCVFIWWIHIYDLYLLQQSYTPVFIRSTMFGWDLVDPSQLFFVLPSVIFQLSLVLLQVRSVKNLGGLQET